MLKLNRMSRVDYAWRRMDSANNLMVINGALMFDGPLDIEQLRQTIVVRLSHYPRFRQLVVLKGNQPYWQDVPHFELEQHLPHRILSENWGRTELQQYMSAQANQPLPADKPLWQMQILENADGRFAIVWRMHHCVADGVALMDIIHHLTDADPVPCVQPAVAGAQPVQAAGIGSKLLQGARLALETSKLGVMISDRKSAIKGVPQFDKQIVSSPRMKLDAARSVARRHEASINDVMCSAIGGALRAYLAEQGRHQPVNMVRAAMTFNLRDKAEAWKLGNEFGLVALDLATGIDEPVQRLQDVKRRTQKIKASLQARATMGILGIAGHLPLALQRFSLNLFTNKASLVITNVEGPKSARWLAGVRMTDMMFWVPQTGNLGVGVSIVSYAGTIQFGVFADQKLMPNPQRLANLCADQFTHLAQAGKAEPLAAPGYVPMPDTIIAM
ncbi:MAG: WS/DGAT domain-containing protein [Chitinivorax sp.]